MDMKDGISNAYRECGVEGFYSAKGEFYRNPHENRIVELLANFLPQLGMTSGKILDLACGSGEVTLAIQKLGSFEIDGIDPFTHVAYFKRTGIEAERWTFEEIEGGVISERSYDMVICSFALYLAEKSRLPLLCYQLSKIGKSLIVLTPHKRPNLREQWGWRLSEEVLQDRVRLRYYTSTLRQERG
jgi:SAM-dependent methyltransferase